MRHLFSNTHVAVFLLVTILFVLCTLLVVSEGWGEGQCVSSLTAPSQVTQPAYHWSLYGWPLTFLTVTTDGCFEARQTQTDWTLAALLVDVLLFLGLGLALDQGIEAYRRARQRVKE